MCRTNQKPHIIYYIWDGILDTRNLTGTVELSNHMMKGCALVREDKVDGGALWECLDRQKREQTQKKNQQTTIPLFIVG